MENDNDLHQQYVLDALVNALILIPEVDPISL